MTAKEPVFMIARCYCSGFAGVSDCEDRPAALACVMSGVSKVADQVKGNGREVVNRRLSNFDIMARVRDDEIAQ
jgi:hypothetical protein